MRIAIPITDGELSAHFGHCQYFELIDVDQKERAILRRETIAAPPHEPGKLPKWLAEHDAEVIIAGGMGTRARDLFSQNGIAITAGVDTGDPIDLVNSFLQGTLKEGDNLCDH